jgi:DNA-binding GntR family transcriptional regulator
MNKEELHRLKILEQQEELEQDDFLEWQELDREIVEAIEEAAENNWGCKVDKIAFDDLRYPVLTLDVNDYIKKGLK